MSTKKEPEQQSLAVADPPLSTAIERPSTLEVWAHLASDLTIPVERLKELMQMQERAEDRDAERQFIAAFARLQLKLPRVVKNGKIDLGRGKPIPFAKWEDIDLVIRPILAAEGMALSFLTKVQDGVTMMVCRLSHVGGHSKESQMPLFQDKGPGRNDMQAWGSGRQYTKRYLACDMLNIVTVGEDNDGKSVGRIDAEQLNTIRDMILGCEMDDAAQRRFTEYMEVERVEDINRSDYEKAMNALRAKLNKLKREGK
jgi:hypothetical protein